jgi:hypothetical protein
VTMLNSWRRRDRREHRQRSGPRWLRPNTHGTGKRGVHLRQRSTVRAWPLAERLVPIRWQAPARRTERFAQRGSSAGQSCPHLFLAGRVRTLLLAVGLDASTRFSTSYPSSHALARPGVHAAIATFQASISRMPPISCDWFRSGSPANSITYLVGIALWPQNTVARVAVRWSAPLLALLV